MEKHANITINLTSDKWFEDMDKLLVLNDKNE